MARTCTAQNRDGNSCQSHVAEGTDRCRHHPRPVVTVRRSDEGGDAALKALVMACLKDRTPISIAYATIGKGPNRRTPKFKPWMFVNSVEPSELYGCHKIEMSNGKSLASSNLFAARVRV